MTLSKYGSIIVSEMELVFNGKGFTVKASKPKKNKQENEWDYERSKRDGEEEDSLLFTW